MQEMIDCPDCEDGWRKAITLYSQAEGDAMIQESRLVPIGDDIHFCGFDPAILCPKCEKEVTR